MTQQLTLRRPNREAPNREVLNGEDSHLEDMGRGTQLRQGQRSPAQFGPAQPGRAQSGPAEPGPAQPTRSAPRTQRSPQRPAPAPDPTDDDLARTAASLALAAVEVLHGLRALRTIARWFEPDLLERIRVSAQLRAELSRTQPPQQVGFSAGRPRVCRIGADTAEACVVIRTRRRHRAVALRLETHRGRWIVTQLLTL